MPLAQPTFPVLRRGHPLAQGLVGAWIPSAGSGLLLSELCGSGADATFSGATKPAWAAGPAGWATTYDGASSISTIYVNTTLAKVTPSIANLANAQGTYTFTAWAKTTASGAIGGTAPWACGNSIIEARNTGGVTLHAWSFGAESGKLATSRGNNTTTGTRISSATSINDGAWHFLAATVNGNNVSLYIDGKLDATGTFGAGSTGDCSVATGTSALYCQIGARTANGGTYANWWNGGLEHLFVFNRTLSADEVRLLYADTYLAFRAPSRLAALARPAGGAGNASGSLSTLTLTAPAATATGSAAASGALSTLTLTAPTATATGAAAATGSLSTLTLTAATGTASAGGAGNATGSLAGLTLTAPTATATGAGAATASGTTLTLTASAASASGAAAATGSLMTLTLSAPTGSANGGSTIAGKRTTAAIGYLRTSSPFAGRTISVA